MKLIIPLAGKGTRMRPLTHSIAKPLIPIAGKPCVERIINTVLKTQGIQLTEIILVVGHLKEQIIEWATDKYDIPIRFVEQTVANGTADAIKLTEPYVKDEDILIIFSDTLFDADLEVMLEEDADGIIWAYEVEDPRRFGVIVTDDEDYLVDFEEKPENPKSNLANMGMHYFKNTRSLFAMIDAIYEQEIRTKGEYFLTDAIDLMAKNGQRIKVIRAEGWYDTGTPEATLKTNELFCKRENTTSVDQTAVVENSKLDNCIVMEGTRIKNANLKNSIIGPKTIIRNFSGQILAGSDDYIIGKE